MAERARMTEVAGGRRSVDDCDSRVALRIIPVEIAAGENRRRQGVEKRRRDDIEVGRAFDSAGAAPSIPTLAVHDPSRSLIGG